MHPGIALAATALLSCSLLAHAQPCPTNDPVTVASNLYRQDHAFIHNGAASPPLSPSLQRLVASNLNRNLEHGEVGPIDWDFWTNAQDGEASADVAAALVSARGRQALVRLTYQHRRGPGEAPADKATDVSLVKGASGCWLIDNLVHNGQDLRKLLTPRRAVGKSKG